MRTYRDSLAALLASLLLPSRLPSILYTFIFLLKPDQTVFQQYCSDSSTNIQVIPYDVPSLLINPYV